MIGEDIIDWKDKEKEPPTKSEIDAEVARLQSEHDAQAYARARKKLYPAIGDQLDDLYHKGAFFQGNSDDEGGLTKEQKALLNRDYNMPTGDDKMDKSVLPAVL